MLASLLVALALPDASPTADKPAAEVRRLLEPVGRPSPERREAATAFAESVAEVIDMVNQGLVLEVAPEHLARLALMELFKQSARKPPADLLQWLNETRRLTPEQVRELLYAAHLRARPAGDPETLRDRVILGMVRAADPFSDWEKNELRCVLYAWYPHGVGLRLQPDRASRLVRIVTPLRNSPADRAGIRAGDLLTEVTLIEDSDGRPLPVPEVIPTRGRSVSEVSAKIQGRKGTRVALTLRQGDCSVRTLRVRRDAVTIPTVLGWRWKEGGWDYWLDSRRRIAYVRITIFDRDTARGLTGVLDRLQKQGMRGLVLDLRFNPGGLLDGGVRIADLFVDDGLLFRLRARNSEESRFKGTREGSRLGFPLACLVNGDSKAMAEIVAACLQDHRRAAIVGERSAGWARIQNITPANQSEFRELRLTTILYLRPNGHKLDRIHLPGHGVDEWGVTPDDGQTVILTARERLRLKEYLDSRDWILPDGQPDAMRDFRDRQRERALAYLRGRIPDDSTGPRR
jgi:carboxyl-terminal processing protease